MPTSLRAIAPSDRVALDALLASDPVTHCFVSARIQAARDFARLSPDLLGRFEVTPMGQQLTSAVYLGANVVPIATDEAARAEYAVHLGRHGRRGSSLVGPADEVMDLWDKLQPRWGRAREIRAHQPLMAMTGESDIAADPLVRQVRPEEIDILLPACIAMFTEEVGVSPVAAGGRAAYRARIQELIREGKALARIDDGRVVFKAEIGATTTAACQVQGVWVAPEFRGRGLSLGGMSAVVRLAQATCAPIVSLYVNDFNETARHVYERVGFSRVGTFSTVLF